MTISALALRLEELGFVRAGYFARVISALTPPSASRLSDDRSGGPAQKYLVLSRVGHRYADAILGTLQRGNISRVDASRLLNTAPAYFAGIEGVIRDRRAAMENAG